MKIGAELAAPSAQDEDTPLWQTLQFSSDFFNGGGVASLGRGDFQVGADPDAIDLGAVAQGGGKLFTCRPFSRSTTIAGAPCRYFA